MAHRAMMMLNLVADIGINEAAAVAKYLSDSEEVHLDHITRLSELLDNLYEDIGEIAQHHRSDSYLYGILRLAMQSIKSAHIAVTMASVYLR